MLQRYGRECLHHQGLLKCFVCLNVCVCLWQIEQGQHRLLEQQSSWRGSPNNETPSSSLCVRIFEGYVMECYMFGLCCVAAACFLASGDGNVVDEERETCVFCCSHIRSERVSVLILDWFRLAFTPSVLLFCPTTSASHNLALVTTPPRTSN